LRRPKHKATLNVAWQMNDALSLDTTVLYVGRWIDGNRDFSIARLTAPAYTTVNLAVSYEVLSHLSVFARAANLFDRHYQDPVGFLQPALGVFVGVRGRL
jgi:vitamin B12 transporter